MIERSGFEFPVDAGNVHIGNDDQNKNQDDDQQQENDVVAVLFYYSHFRWFLLIYVRTLPVPKFRAWQKPDNI